VEFDTAEWCGGHRCGARRCHEPWQGLGQADGARPRQVEVGARGAGGGEGTGELTRCEWGRRERGQGPSRDQSDRAGDAGGTD
jgi:hypothetical protein